MNKIWNRISSVLVIGGLTAVLCSCGASDGNKAGEQNQTVSSASITTESTSTLKDALASDFKVGAAVNYYELTDKDEMKLVKQHFNSITMENEMKPENVLDQKTSEQSEDGMPGINTDNLNRILSQAKENGLNVRGHCLVWHSQTPKWFFCESYEESKPQVSKAVLQKRMESYIQKVLTYCQENYPGVVYAWDVVNEACADDGGYRTDSSWYQIYGDESYILDAFTFAKKYAAEGVKLFYNDYNEYVNAKMKTISELLRKLKKQNLVDGMGMQSHWDMEFPDIDMLEAAIDEYKSIDGLELQFTEIDMHNTDNSEEGLRKQADRYQEFFNTIIKEKRRAKANITGITFWGLKDDGTWLTSFKGEESFPLLLDKNGNRKPCYESILQVAKGNNPS